MKVVLSLLAIIALAQAGPKIRYDNYKVFRITPNTPEEAKYLASLEEKGVNFWDGPAPAGKPSDMMFPPHLQGDLLDSLKASGMKVESFVEDVQSLINIQESAPKSPRLDWTNYYSVEDIYKWMDDMALEHDIATVGSLGKSFEGKDIKYMEITRGGGTEKQTIWVDANIHAREWITNPIALYLINQLLTNSDYDHWLDRFHWVIAPMLNPDGYEYSRTTDRMWRKTRSSNSGTTCRGTDANRNFGYHWMDGGASSNPCSDTFGGSSAFSEVETDAVRVFLEARENVAFYLSLHSYSQLILISYGLQEDSFPFDPIHHPSHDQFLELATAAANAHRVRYGTNFRPGNIVDLLYVASGGSMDWALGSRNIPLGFTYEMRDTGQNGFILPPSQIIPSCEEFMDGFKVYVDYLIEQQEK